MNEKADKERQERFSEVHEIFAPRNFSHSWYRLGDPVQSMQNAIMVRLAQHLVWCQWPEDAVRLRDFMEHVFALRPYVTTAVDLIGLVTAAAQMVERSSVYERDRLIALFVDFKKHGP
jgi:hypothetical protein